MLQFTVQDLKREQLPSAWPLIRAGNSSLDLGRWLSAGRDLIDRGGGVLGVATEEGALHGVATYEPVDRYSAGKLLQVDTLVTFELSGRAPVRRVLCEALERLAPTLGCVAVAVNVVNRGYLWEVQKRNSAAADAGADAERPPRNRL